MVLRHCLALGSFLTWATFAFRTRTSVASPKHSAAAGHHSAAGQCLAGDYLPALAASPGLVAEQLDLLAAGRAGKVEGLNWSSAQLLSRAFGFHCYACLLAGGPDAGVRTPRFAADPLYVVEGKRSMKQRQPAEAPDGLTGPASLPRAEAPAAMVAFMPAGIRLFWA